MSTQTPQSALPEWMAKLADPANWQAWARQQGASLPSLPSMPSLADLPRGMDPEVMKKLQGQYMEQLSALWADVMAARPLVVEDRRFSTPAWQSNALYAFNAAAYLLNAKFMLAMTDALDATPKVKQKLRFAIQQSIDAMSPANFLATNPEALQKIISSKGESLTRGINQMLEDLQKGRISHTDDNAFEVGVNVATSEGAVVFENRLFQLIQYKPLTRTVHSRPLLLVPPCINKYYILDLQPANSLVRYAVEQGHTVFLVSWVNPGTALGQVTWDDYIDEGAITAIDTVRRISGQDQINTLGFCVGGTILSTALAVMYGRGEKPAASMTLLTALLDFSDTGVLDVYIDEEQIGKREKDIGKGGLMPARDFSAAFSSLRPNDLVWNYVESNYLKGEQPPAFDLLYWNADATNLPGPMFCWYLRNLYLNDLLKSPGRLHIAGQDVDLGKIATPAFIYASREDHIVPWTSAFASTGLLNPKKPGQNKFVLGASGHIAGVINPPARKKRSYWRAEGRTAKTFGDAEKWMASATEYPGSWWTEWNDFLVSHAGEQVKAPAAYGSTAYPAIEAAPGRYVKVKAAGLA